MQQGVVAHINPASPSVGLPFGQDRHRRVVAVQSLGRENVSLNPPEERRQRSAATTHLIGQGRQTEGYALPGVAFGLAVERLMLPVLLEQDHRQQAGAGPTPGNYMERRRSLADLLAVAAGELFADMLGHLPLPWDDLQRLGDILANLGSRGLPQHRQTVGPGSLTRSRGKCSGKGWRAGRLRVNATTLVVLDTARSAAISSWVAELSSSSSASSI